MSSGNHTWVSKFWNCFLIFLITSLSVVSAAVIQQRGSLQEMHTSTPVPWSPQKDSSGERVRRQYPYGYNNYGLYNGMYGGYSGYGGYGGYGGYPYNQYSGYSGYQFPYTNSIFPLPGGYYPGSIVGSGSMWAAGGGLVGNMLSFLIG